MFEKKSRRIPLDSLQVQILSGRKRSNLTGKVGTEIFHGVLPGTVHQDKTFEFKRGEIGCGAFKSIFTGVSQVKSADDDPDGDVRTGFPACFDRIDNSGMATADNQQSGSQQERLFLRDESLFPGILQLSAQSRCFSAFRYQGRIRVRARSKHIRSPTYRRRRKPADADKTRSRVLPLWPEAQALGLDFSVISRCRIVPDSLFSVLRRLLTRKTGDNRDEPIR